MVAFLTGSLFEKTDEVVNYVNQHKMWTGMVWNQAGRNGRFGRRKGDFSGVAQRPGARQRKVQNRWVGGPEMMAAGALCGRAARVRGPYGRVLCGGAGRCGHTP